MLRNQIPGGNRGRGDASGAGTWRQRGHWTSGARIVLPTRKLIAAVQSRVSRQTARWLARRSDLVVYGTILNVAKSRPGAVTAFELIPHRIFAHRPGFRVVNGEHLSCRVPPVTWVDSVWAPVTGPPVADREWPTRGSTPLAVQGISGVFFLRKALDEVWEPLPSTYAFWRVQGDAARVVDDLRCAPEAPAVLSALDVESFARSVSSARLGRRP